MSLFHLDGARRPPGLVPRAKIRWLAIYILALGVAACGGGGGDGGGASAGGSPPPTGGTPSPGLDCSAYRSAKAASGILAVFGVPESEFVGTPSVTTKQRWTECLYATQNLQNRFDFLVFFNNVEFPPAGTTKLGVHTAVANSIQGIGRSIFDNSQAWGLAPGALQSVIHHPSLVALELALVHEVAHRWSTELLTDNESSGSDTHWGFSSANGVHGGFDIATLRRIGPQATCPDAYGASRSPYDTSRPENFGFGPNGNLIPLSAVELYLMGLADISQLPEFLYVAPGAYFVQESFLFCAPNGFLQYPLRDLILSRFGPRTPDTFNSQTVFDVLFVLVTGDTLFQSELDQAEELIRRLVFPGNDSDADFLNFWEATGGRARLNAGPLL